MTKSTLRTKRTVIKKTRRNVKKTHNTKTKVKKDTSSSLSKLTKSFKKLNLNSKIRPSLYTGITVSVTAGVWGHAGIIDKKFAESKYTDPVGTKLNLIAFRPHGFCSWGSIDTRSRIDVKITNMIRDRSGDGSPKELLKLMTKNHNDAIREVRAYRKLNANHEPDIIDPIGKNIYGFTSDYGASGQRGNKFYQPMGVNKIKNHLGDLVIEDVALLDNKYTKILARVYNIDITFNGQVYSKEFRTAIKNDTQTTMNSSKNILKQFKGRNTTFYKSGDILIKNDSSSLQQVVTEISHNVAKIVDIDYIIKEIADKTGQTVNINDIVMDVSLIDNNCNYVPATENNSAHKVQDTGSFEPKSSQAMDTESL
jgi:hypothetical protein